MLLWECSTDTVKSEGIVKRMMMLYKKTHVTWWMVLSLFGMEIGNTELKIMLFGLKARISA